MTNETSTTPLPSPGNLKSSLPSTKNQRDFIKTSRETISAILSGKDPRLLLILGPCSIHDEVSAIEYATKLKTLSAKLSDTFFFVMRTYFEKPRTSLGWKGMLYDPHLNGSNDIASGLTATRRLLLQLAEMGVPAATEFLDPATPQYISDLISWACIGARTVESQIHRQIASGLPMPVSFKNSTSGNVDVAINGILSASYPHTFFAIDDTGHIGIRRTQGNPDCHITLRGGDGRPNFDPSSLSLTLQQLRGQNLPEQIIVDCSHDNSSRDYEAQTTVFESIIGQYIDGNTSIRGLILESHLNAGSQSFSSDTPLKYAVSITDACLDWTATERLVTAAAERLNILRAATI